MEADKARVLFAFFEIVGAGVDAVVQFGQALCCRGQALVRLTSRYIQGLGLSQVACGNGLGQGINGLDQGIALAAQVNPELRQRANKCQH